MWHIEKLKKVSYYALLLLWLIEQNGEMTERKLNSKKSTWAQKIGVYWFFVDVYVDGDNPYFQKLVDE